MYPRKVDTTKNTRQIDVEVASIMYHTEHLHVDWYHHEIIGFYEENNPLMKYSFDEDSCNATVYANGVDAKDGIAKSLPGYSTSLGDFQEVIDWIRRQGGNMYISLNAKYSLVHVYKDEEDVGIEYMASAPDGNVTLDNSDIALAGCHAFIAVYGDRK